jgi:hypothetical protein
VAVSRDFSSALRKFLPKKFVANRSKNFKFGGIFYCTVRLLALKNRGGRQPSCEGLEFNSVKVFSEDEHSGGLLLSSLGHSAFIGPK